MELRIWREGRLRLYNLYFALKKVPSEAASSEFVLDCC